MKLYTYSLKRWDIEPEDEGGPREIVDPSEAIPTQAWDTWEGAVLAALKHINECATRLRPLQVLPPGEERHGDDYYSKFLLFPGEEAELWVYPMDVIKDDQHRHFYEGDKR